MLIQSMLAAQASTASQEPVALEPNWTRVVEAGIEWCAPVGPEPASGLVLCSKKALVDLIDLQIGRSRWAEPIPVQPGTRFAGHAEGVAYGSGISRVYAFPVERSAAPKHERPGPLWQVAAAPKADTQGDPEFMTRLVDAGATPSGVMIVRSDGRVAELDHKDGRLRWQHKLPNLANGTLHVHGASAALLWKDGDVFHVAFFDLKSDEPRPKMTTIKDTLPIWTKLIDEGLVAVWPKRFAVIGANGTPRFRNMHEDNSATASTVAVYLPAARGSTEAMTQGLRPATLLVLGSGKRYCWAYDVDTGEVLWSQNKVFMATWPDAGASSFRIVGECVLCAAADRFSVSRVDTGAEVSVQRRYAWTIEGVGVFDGFAYGLFSGRLFPRDTSHIKQEIRRIDDEQVRKMLSQRLSPPDPPWPIYLVRQIMTGVPWSRPNEPVTLEAREFPLGEAGRIRNTFWLGGTLVVVEDKRVRAYTLP